MRSLTSAPGSFLSKPARFAVLCLFILYFSLSLRSPQTVRAQSQHPGANVVAWQTLQAAQHVPTSYQGRAQTVSKLQSGLATPLAMASADFDSKGVADLVVGYAHSGGGILALHRGNLDAFAPQSHASWLAIANEQFPSPFLSQAAAIDVPEAPDFVLTGDFTGNGHIDLLTGARGSQKIYVLMGDGKGKFSSPQAITMPGALTALAAGQVGVHDGKADVVAGIQTTAGSAVLVYKGSAGGLSSAAVAYPMPQAATQLEIADLHGDGFSDVAVLAGAQALIIHPTASAGADTTSLVETVPVGGSVRSIAAGGFVWDRDSRNQLAVLLQSGIVQVLSPDVLDTRPFTAQEVYTRRVQALHNQLPVNVKPTWAGQAEAWNVVKSFSVSSPLSGKVRMSAVSLAHSRPQDLMVVDSADSRLHILPANTTGDPADDGLELTVDTKDSPLAVLPVRVNSDARPGLVFVGKSPSHPKTMAPLPDPTFSVNRFDDPAASVALAATYCLGVPGDCSLREAVIKANSVAGSDTIMLPVGTITLTQIGLEENAAVTGDLDVTDTLAITGHVDGSGNPTSIIQGCGGNSGVACSTNPNNVTSWNDKFISTNKLGTTGSASLSISNVTFQHGNNTNSPSSGTFDYLGGAVDFFGCAPEGGGCTGTGGGTVSSLTITNVRFLSNFCDGTANICGGGLDSEFGPTTISTSLFSGNTALGQAGALSLVGAKESMTITNTKFDNSTAANHSNTDGGALYINFENGAATGNVSIHNSTFSNNTANGQGGGIYINLAAGIGGTNQATANIDQSTVISGNSASSGGGIDFQGLTGGPTANTALTMSKVTLTGNHGTSSSADGGGGMLLNGGGTLNLQYSRIVNNTSAASGKPTGISIESGVGGSASVVNASDNWWGCNSGPSASPCDIVAIVGGSGATLTDSPWIVLTHTANPTSVLFGGSSTLTGDFLHEFNGSVTSSISLSNIDVLLGLDIVFANPVGGSIPQAQPESIQSNGTATATFNSGACGNGSATARVDNVDVANTTAGETVIAKITTLCPDLMATKTNSISQSVANATTVLTSTGASWNWNINVQNAGSQATAAADFTTGQVILTDTLPSTNITYGTPTNNGTNVNCSITSNVLTCSASAAVTLPIGGGFTVTVPATATVVGTYTNPTGGSCAVDPNDVIHENDETNNNCNTNSVTVTAPDLTATKTNDVSGSVPLSPGTWNWTITVANSNASTSSPATFASGQTILIDSLPNTNITYGSASVGSIVGTVTNSANISCRIASNVLTCSASGAAVTIGTGSSFGVKFGATATAAGTYLNPTGGTCSVDPNNNVTESNEGNNACSDSVTVVAPPTISKGFSPTTIGVNGTSTLTFTINNPNTGTTLSGIAFSDTLPAGVQVAAAPNVVGACGGSVTATAGSGTISLASGTLAATGTCAISVDVTGTTSGTKNNTTGAITSTNGGTGTTSNTATLTVASPPTISKAFGATSIPLNGTTNLTFSINNPNSGLGLTGVAFADSLPAGLQVASTPNTSNTCNGTFSAPAGATSVNLSAGTMAAGGSCSISVDVTGTTAGGKNNTTGAISSTESGAGATSNTASITVVAPPSIAKMFNPASIPLNGTTALTFTVTNPAANSVAEAGVAFSDTLPTGLVVATPNGLINNCGGTATATAGSTSISLTGGMVPVNNSCTVTVNITGSAAGDFTNTSGAVSSTNGGTGNTASAGLTVVAPPSMAKVFNPTTIAVNGVTTLTFTITNPAANTVAEAGVAFSDTLPSGLVVATPNGLTDNCGGTATATAGSTSISLSGGTVAVNSSCTVTANITSSTSGNYTNTSGAVSSTNGGTGNTATASLTVATPPTTAKAFGATSIPLNGTTNLTLTITNPNSSLNLTGLAFTDNLPAGLTVASVPNLNNTCGGSVTGTGAGSTSFSLSGGSLAASASCSVSLNVTGTTAGLKNNSTTSTSNETGPGTPGSASITVVAPPTITKGFGAPTVALNGTTSVNFSINNPNSTALTGIGFTDTLPVGLQVASNPNTSNSCGGTLSAGPGTGIISLSGGSATASNSCLISVDVTGTSAGAKNNTTGPVTSTEGGTGGASNTATVSVVAPPSMAKAFNPTTIAVNGVTTLTFTITNPAANSVSELGVAFSDTLPAGLVVATPNGLTDSCGGTPTATAGSTSISLSGGTVAVNSSCTVTANITSSTSGNYTNTSGAVSSTNGGTGNTATANLTVATPPTTAKAFGAATVPLSGTTSLTLTITNPNSSLGLTGVAFTDTLPSGLVVAAGGANNTCGGSVSGATSGSGSFSLSGGSLAASASCSVGLNVTGTTAGAKFNSTASGSNETGPGPSGNASITVVAPPTISKGFGASSIPVNGSTTLTLSIHNPNTTVGLTGLSFSDSFPAGLVVSATPGLSNTCGGSVGGATSGSTSISLSGGSEAGGGSCSVSVNVTGTTAGVENNTTGAVSSTEGGTGTTSNTATVTVVAPPSISKAFGATNIPVNGTTSLTLTITNPNSSTVLNGVAVADNFPLGLQVAASPGGSNTCGGTFAPAAGNTSISLSGGMITGGGSCAVTVNVTATTSGPKVNTTGSVSSTNGGTGNTGSATLGVGDFTISASPATQTIPAGHMAVYTLTLSTTTGFTGTINLGCSGGPPKSTCTIIPPSVNLTSSSTTAKVTVDLAVPKGASLGTFTLTFTGTSATLTHSTTAKITIK